MIGELNDRQIDEVLASQTLGRIGCHARGKTYVVPVGYVFDGSSVYSLSARGMKIDMMRENPQVCFEVEQVEHWSRWKSVIAWGSFEELAGDEAESARTLLRSRLTPLVEFEAHLRRRDDQPRVPGAAEPPLITFRIALTERTGRYEQLD